MKIPHIRISILLVAIFLTSSVIGYGQIDFEPGYYVDNNDQKIHCFIKNIDWKSNPSEFEYKTVSTDEPRTMGVATVKEFGVTNTIHKYYRFTVGIDRSTEVTSGLSIDRTITVNEEQLFLRPLIEGKASLYVYEDRGIIKYFYKVDDGAVEQLLYKKYKTDDNRIGEVNKYREQIWNNLKCESISMTAVENIVYKKQSLVKLFSKYNECHNSEFVVTEIKGDRNFFNMMIRPGLNKSSLLMTNRVSKSRDTDFGSESAYRFGLELEFVLPFNKNKWALVVEPTYHSFKDEQISPGVNQFFTYDVTVDYTSIEIPIGIRHYFFIDSKSKVFLNWLYMIDLSMGSAIDFKVGNNLADSYEIGTRGSSVFGGGYNFNNKFNIELRYGSRDILNSYSFWSSEYTTLSLILGVAIF
ncbi:MAG: tRNA modification GTPase [Cyclobacteriaceae bacterium]|nr:tRNA modification GTPase [Cyclobacteriaceae bacterium]